jgi:hypothetical protein
MHILDAIERGEKGAEVSVSIPGLGN